jgi:hypothetical protein
MANRRVGPEIRLSPEPQPQQPSFLERCFDIYERAAKRANVFARSLVGYGDPIIETDCSPGEIGKATFRGYVFLATPVIMGTLSTLAANSLANDGFSLFRCVACFGLAGYVAAADATILHTLAFRRGIGDMRDGGVYIKLPSDDDLSTRRIVAFRITWSGIFGVLVAASIGLALNASAIDRRLTEDDLARNSGLIRQGVSDYNTQLDHARAAYTAEQAEIDRLTRLQQIEARRPQTAPRRNTLAALDRRLSLEKQKLDQEGKAVDQLIASRPERLQHALTVPGYIPPSHGSVVSRFRGFVEVVHDDVFSAMPVLAIDALILGIDVFNLCLGGIGSLGRYPARFARRRLEELTEEARAAAANMGAVADTAADTPGTSDLNGQTPHRGPGRPKGSKSKPKMPESAEAGHE